MKSDKMLCMIHSDTESLIGKIDNSNNDLEKSSTKKKKKNRKKYSLWLFNVNYLGISSYRK